MLIAVLCASPLAARFRLRDHVVRSGKISRSGRRVENSRVFSGASSGLFSFWRFGRVTGFLFCPIGSPEADNPNPAARFVKITVGNFLLYIPNAA